MKTISNLSKILLLSSSLLSLNALAESQKYGHSYNFVDVKTGLVSPKMTSSSMASSSTGKETFSGALSFNRKFIDTFSLGLELNYRPGTSSKNSLDGISSISWNTSFTSLMPTFSVDLLKQKSIRPYLHGSVGYSMNKVSKVKVTDSLGNTTSSKGDTTRSITWKMGAGLDIASCNMFDVLIEYAYYSRGKIKTKDITVTSNSGASSNTGRKTAHYYDHVFSVGLRFKF